MAHCLRQWAGCSLAAGADGTPSRELNFLFWIAGNPLKSPKSDEGIQENPSLFSWSCLVWLGFGLEEFGLNRRRHHCKFGPPLRAISLNETNAIQVRPRLRPRSCSLWNLRVLRGEY